MTARAVASARTATGSTLLEQDLPEAPAWLECGQFEIERSIAPLLVTALSHIDGTSAVRMHVMAPSAGDADAGRAVVRAVLTLDAPGTRVPTGELSRVVARFTAATCDAATVGAAAAGAKVQVSRGAIVVRSGTVEARSAASGTTVTRRWPPQADLTPRVTSLTS